MSSRSRAKKVRQQLREAREELGLTMQEAADRVAAILGVDSLSKQSISLWEKDRRQPRIDHMAAWARAVDRRLVVKVLNPQAELVEVEVSPDVVHLAELLSELEADDIPIVETMIRRFTSR